MAVVVDVAVAGAEVAVAGVEASRPQTRLPWAATGVGRGACVTDRRSSSCSSYSGLRLLFFRSIP